MRHHLAALLLLIAPAFAEPGLLTVAGQGGVVATPDAVTINTGVVTTARTAREALAANSQTMTSVFDALKKLGVPDKAIRNTNLNLSPQYAAVSPGNYSALNDRPIIGYRITNSVHVALDDPHRAGTVLDALVAAGANEAGGLSYVFKDDKGLISQARSEAVKNAIERAHTYAAAAGVALGPIRAITDTGNVFPQQGVVMSGASFAAPPPPPAPIGVGEQTLRANVTVSWEIRQ